MAKKEMGRPRIPIDWEEFEKLCQIHCTEIEIAEWFSMSVDTLNRVVKRKYKQTFAEVFKYKASKGKMSLRRKMFQTAMGDGRGSGSMQIWLSKQHLGMKERIENDVKDVTPPEVKEKEVETLVELINQVRNEC